MKIYLVVEYYDYGPGWGLGEIIKGFNKENEANLLRDQLNEEDKQIQEVDENNMSFGLTWYPPFHVQEVEVE
jgi:hypothetical protein